MSKKKKRLLNKTYHPDYRALYPGVTIPPKLLEALRESDRKMEYIEYELKHSRVRRNADGEIINVTPPREDSLERLLEADMQFAALAPTPAEMLDAVEEKAILRRCLDKLEPEELALIRALYHDRRTEREYGKELGLSQKTVNYRKHQVLVKITKLMEI